MKLRIFVFVCYLLGKVSSTEALDKTTPTSLESAIAVPGKNAILPCRLDVPIDISQVSVIEWQKIDVDPPLTVHAQRHGKELPKEKAIAYRERTKLFTNGSLMLLDSQLRDNGTYRCDVIVKVDRKQMKNSIVSLFIAESADVNITLSETAVSKTILCESRGWNPKPTITVRNGQGHVLSAETNVHIERDNHYAVQARLAVPSNRGTQSETITVICKVEVPLLAKENSIRFHDESNPGDKCFIQSHWSIVVVICVIFFVLFVVFFIFLLNAKLFSSLWRQKGVELNSSPSSEELLQNNDTYTEHGDINVSCCGASEDTARAHSLTGHGEDVSKKIAGRHSIRMYRYKSDIIAVGKQLNIHPALIAAIISKQSAAGGFLGANGFGKLDPNCFGLMQINKLYHPVSGGPFSRHHIEQGTTFLIQFMKKIKLKRPDWSPEEQLKGALACYIAGDEIVLNLPENDKEVDHVTPYKDFSNDVLARAQWFSSNGYQ